MKPFTKISQNFILKKLFFNWINSLIPHNSSGHALSSSLFIFPYAMMEMMFPYAMMEMTYLGSTEFSNYETNWLHTNKGGTKSGATTPRVLKISREMVVAPVYPICTLVYSKYPNTVTSSTYLENGGKPL
ncbi:hypothetical protein AMTR_s00077p00071650 [Amborella trichopoda]|uniref:Uncharacterized protein n=1 Tax=Amborella trichopoda TaxID=13333 RepID=W1PAU7_AMBTC|nr:hypothetical protein AMTR_s00077p00071650 [Amborella trichopoda]